MHKLKHSFPQTSTAHTPLSDVNTALISADERSLCLQSLSNHIPEVMTLSFTGNRLSTHIFRAFSQEIQQNTSRVEGPGETV